MLLACSSQSHKGSDHVAVPDRQPDSLTDKLERLEQQGEITVRGFLVLKTPSGVREGDYALTINGDDMSMDIFAKGLKVGDILIKDNVATVRPGLRDEYLEYMFAVIIRDSIAWWNIYGYELLIFPDYYILRNSWKKLYIRTDMMTPSRQIFRLMKFRTVEVMYSDERPFRGEMLPSNINFNYSNYDCKITISSLEF